MSANNRASLLSGLRTGGVRSSNIPHTAAPGVTSFNIPRVPSSRLNNSVFPEEEEEGQYAQNVFVNHGSNRTMPMTAAVDGPNNRFLQQQQRENPNMGSFSPAFAAQPNHVQAQALQMQMMQLEFIRLQTIQAQQYQAQMLAAQQQPQSARRPSFNPPATAGPTGSFDLRPTPGAQMRRQQDEMQVPMTAALGGKFGIRAGRFPSEDYDESPIPVSHNSTTVISGGTSLGGNGAAPAQPTVSKSESASNWRRAGNNNSVLRAANRPSLGGKTSPPLVPSLGKSRPSALSLNGTVTQPVPAVAVAIDSSEGENEDGYSTSSSDSVASNSPPTTPRSSSSDKLSVSPPKDIAVKAIPGLGHPISASPPKASYRTASQPVRQPRGPPSGPDELGSRNFASRLVPRLTVSVA